MFLQLVSSFKERKRIENEKSKEYKITKKKVIKTEYSGDYSAVVLPESIPNSEVKCRNADGSVGIPHVRVGHRQIEFKRNITAFFLSRPTSIRTKNNLIFTSVY